ncbi:hypothetical protein POJ06DRAFT_280030 [Lipomyces tetrasporus]|uniref:Fungal-type protein kinase domain-containing protein n=1 Tax=Lipomyces tetrasporus TaxID=54092 RepID=A0AAD7QWC9_9ASCO|nr:uncharacterized protein POJ06DRAFT_280030 [Lipomyces tetrasporus]KAJ8102674.1 hypothetical protein POJ06DRAFT_280030 [Lipomyces tetrasporus]
MGLSVPSSFVLWSVCVLRPTSMPVRRAVASASGPWSCSLCLPAEARLRRALRTRRCGLPSARERLARIASPQPWGDLRLAKNLLLDLILALQNAPAASSLTSQLADRTLAGDLASLYNRVDSNKLDTALAIPLVEHALGTEFSSQAWNDEGFWNTVLNFATQIEATPPAVFEKATFATPLRTSSASQSGIEQTHGEVDQRILEELTGASTTMSKTWTNKALEIYKLSVAQYAWSGWPEPPLQAVFFEWLKTFQDILMKELDSKYYTSVNRALRGSEADRKLDIFVAPVNATFQDSKYNWSNVLDRSIKTLVQLAGYAREVFGNYSSEKFDIHSEPERFVTVIAGYALMTEAELGLNTFVRRDETGRYIIAGDTKVSIEDKPIAPTKAIVCRGTTCYRGRRIALALDCVVKFAWPSDKRQREGRLLKLAQERGVKGVAEWIHDEQVSIDGTLDPIANLRRGMKFGEPRKFVEQSTVANSRTRSSLQSRSRASIGRLSSLGVRTSSTSNSSAGQKRKRDEGSATEGGTMKRSKSNDSQREHGRGASTVQSIEEPEDDSLAGRDSEAYGNRIHICLVTSVRGLLEAIRDAVAAHRSLLEVGKMLHRDISENNIIITLASVKGDPKGRLIDMDLGKELNSVPSGASHRTGTMQFMAIEVLQGKGHTYRHDLESFFYVFIWMCIRHGSKKSNPLPASRLRRWYSGTYAEIADTKLGHMDKNGFENVVAEFAQKFENIKSLARSLRDVLFPIRDGAIFTERFAMYDGLGERDEE